MLWEKLSPRERDVCELLIKAYQIRDIANKLNIGRRTVKSHLTTIYIKLDIKKSRHKNIVLAVALVYDRFPHLRILGNLQFVETERAPNSSRESRRAFCRTYPPPSR